MTIPLEPSYFEILLNKGQVSRVDQANFQKHGGFKWRARWNPHTRSYYALRTLHLPGRKTRVVYLHREILGLGYKDQDKREGDHAFHDTLDNREFVDGKENLRIANKHQQARNKRKRSDNTSGFKGVSWHKKCQKWVARIRVNGKYLHLGLFVTAEAAYTAYCVAAVLYYGEFARLE